jgi:hypothetical protein
MILLKNPPFILREPGQFIQGTNGAAVEIIGDFPFMLSLVEAFLGFFSRIKRSIRSPAAFGATRNRAAESGPRGIHSAAPA